MPLKSSPSCPRASSWLKCSRHFPTAIPGMFGCFQDPCDQRSPVVPKCHRARCSIPEFIPISSPIFKESVTEMPLATHWESDHSMMALTYFLSQHMSAWQHCLQSSGVFQLGSEQGQWMLDSGHWEWPSQPLQSVPNKIWIQAAVILIT